MNKQLLIIATLDTKGRETEFVRNCAQTLGINPILMDIGILGNPPIIPDITKLDLAAATGVNLLDLINKKDRAKAVQAMEDGGALVARRLLEENRLDGVIMASAVLDINNIDFVHSESDYDTILEIIMQEYPIGIQRIEVK